MALDKVKDDMLQDNLVFPGSTTQFPSLTTTQRNALSSVQPGTLIYNSTVGKLQQYDGNNQWASIDSPPVITSITYPTESGEVLTALDASGGTEAAQTLIINGSNFSSASEISVQIQVSGSYVAFASSISVNTAKTQITCTGVTKRAAADDYVIKVTNVTGLSATTTVNFNADPSFQTAANLGSVLAGTFTKDIAFTGTKVIQGATAKPTWMTVTGDTSTADNGSGDTTFDATGSPITLGGTAANTGTSQAHVFSIIVRDAENQTFNRDFTLTVASAPTGGTITTYTGYRVHSYTTVGTNQGGIFTLYAATTADILIIAGGGGGSGGTHGGAGAGAGGMRVLTSQSLNAGTYNVVVGGGGAGGSGASSIGANGNDSSLIQATGTGSFSSSATAGGRAANNVVRTGANGGSGGGASETYSTDSNINQTATTGGTGDGAVGSNGNTAGYYGGDGGDGAAGADTARFSGSGGGGAGGDGANGYYSGGYKGALGGVGLENSFRTGSAVKYAGGGAGNGDQTGHSSGGGIPFGGGTSPGGGSVGGAGTANTGGGGGGGGPGGGAGGSGIVVIRYAV